MQGYGQTVQTGLANTTTPTCVGPSLQQLLHERNKEIKQTRAAQHVHEELLIKLKHLPEDDVDLLSEVYLLDRVR